MSEWDYVSVMRALDSGDYILVNEASWKRLFAAGINFRKKKKKLKNEPGSALAKRQGFTFT